MAIYEPNWQSDTIAVRVNTYHIDENMITVDPLREMDDMAIILTGTFINLNPVISLIWKTVWSSTIIGVIHEIVYLVTILAQLKPFLCSWC